MIAYTLVQTLMRGAWYGTRALRHRWHPSLQPEDWDRQMKAHSEAMAAQVKNSASVGEASVAVQTPVERQGLSLTGKTREAVPRRNMIAITEAVDTHAQPSQVLIRYGAGFSVVSRFYRKQGRITRVIWLDYNALKRRHGAFVVRRLRLRAGEAGARPRRQGSAPGGAAQDWGRVALPDEVLQFESLQDLSVVQLMERSLTEATQLIETEIPDNLVNRKPWHLLSPCVAPGEEPSDVQKRTTTQECTLEEMRAHEGRRNGLSAPEKTYPNLVKPPVVVQHSGVLRKTGYVERTDPSGRKYRTFFAELEDEVQTVRHTGVDLQRALLREEVNIGDRVEVFTIGLVPTPLGQYKKKIWSARKLPP
jgi:hypothetical protein